MNIDQQEVKKFSGLAEKWWDKGGDFKPLHIINPLRANYIENKISCKGREILDVGCGRGKIISILSKKYQMNNLPLGIDIVDHKDVAKKIRFIKINALNYLNKTMEQLELKVKMLITKNII